MNQNCSIIIPHRKQPETLQLCLDRLIELGYGDCEIIVVNNGESVPGFLTKYPVKVYRTDEYPSPYIARNKGIEEASNAVIVLLDANCLVQEGWLESGLKLVDENSIVSGMPEKPDSEMMDGWQRFDYLYSSLEDAKKGEIKALPAGNLFFYRSVWEKVGPFPEVRSLGDMAWTYRAYLEGYTMKISENAIYRYPYKSRKSFLSKYKRIGFGMGENGFVKRSFGYILKNISPPSPGFVSRFWRKDRREEMGLGLFRIIFFCWCVKIQYARGYFKFITEK